jgi:thiol-disulfide isomerase/thioredoxin
MRSSSVWFLLLAFFLAQPARADALDLGAYKGKVVYLDFWASWCVPCRLSFPWMNQLQQSYGDKGLVVVAVDMDRDRGKAEEFLSQMPAAFRVVFDPSGQIARGFAMREMPTSVLIGRDGKPRFVHDGFFPAKEGEYLAHLSTLLKDGS